MFLMSFWIEPGDNPREALKNLENAVVAAMQFCLQIRSRPYLPLAYDVALERPWRRVMYAVPFGIATGACF